LRRLGPDVERGGVVAERGQGVAAGERQTGHEPAQRLVRLRAGTADLLADALLALAVEHDLRRHATPERPGVGLEVTRLAALDDELEVREAGPGGGAGGGVHRGRA
jgi:hypothetical protein